MEKESNFIELNNASRVWAVGSIHSNLDSLNSIKKYILNNFEEKDKLVISIANQMKRSYINWNKSNVLDNVIFSEIEEISNGKIKIPENTTLENINIYQKTFSQYKGASRKKNNHRIKKNNYKK